MHHTIDYLIIICLILFVLFLALVLSVTRQINSLRGETLTYIFSVILQFIIVLKNGVLSGIATDLALNDVLRSYTYLKLVYIGA